MTLIRSAAAAALVCLSGCASWNPGRAALAATGFTSHVMCDDVFVSGVAPPASFEQRVGTWPGRGWLTGMMTQRVDRERGEVAVTLAGAFESRARFDAGGGCRVLLGGEPAAVDPMPAGTPESPAIRTDNPRLQAALERAMGEADDGLPPHNTHAIVVMRDGALIAEHYAPGYGVDTPVLGFSATKSVTSALIGILVRQGRLAPDQPAPLPEWRAAGDPRGAITVEHLLRQASGLDIVQDNSGFDDNAHIMYSVADKAGAAAAAPLAVAPGTRWAYTDTNYILLSRLLRDANGGSAAGVLRFARDELFTPLGMRHVVFDTDVTGTPIGASHLMASARDWARLGQLYLDDGVAGGRRILPPGWVKKVTTPTLATGYGAGLWTNRVPGRVPGWGVPWGLSKAPADAFFARGFMGQFVVVVPSRRLVIVRLSSSQRRGDDIEGTDELVGDVLAALGDNS